MVGGTKDGRSDWRFEDIVGVGRFGGWEFEGMVGKGMVGRNGWKGIFCSSNG